MADLKRYLDLICGDIPFCSDEVRVELSQHIEQAAAKLEAEGHGPEEALAVAIREFGDPAEIAAGLAEAHRRGGGAMYRRVVLPALIAAGVSFGAVAVEGLARLLNRHAIESMFAAPGPLVMLPVLPRFDWLVLIAVFLCVRLCAARGGSRSECVAVALAPIVVVGVLAMLLGLLLARLWVLPLAFGLGYGIAAGGITVGSAVAVRELLQQSMGIGAACLAATWLYFFAVRHMQERPFWLAAEESQTQAT